MITLTYGAEVLTLPPDMFWVDEFDWQPVEQVANRSITGALLVDIGARQAGRPVTLQPEDDSCAWMPLVLLTALRAWAAVAGREMTLNIRGATRSVLFRHQDGAIEVRPVVHYNQHEDSDWFLVTLRFMEI